MKNTSINDQKKLLQHLQKSTKPKLQLAAYIRLFLLRHFYALVSGFERLWHAPFTSLMTIGVVGIALSLPASFFVFLQNIQIISGHWNKSTQISLFLKMDTTGKQIQDLLEIIKSKPEVVQAYYITPEQGLKEFEQQSNFGDILSQLPDNPLPGVIVIQPTRLMSPDNIKQFAENFKKFPQIDIVQLDMDWVNRFYAMTKLAKQMAWALSILLGLAVLLIVGNTLRLVLQKYHTEIEVVKLVGATNAFARRPFLYTGLLYGFFGALCAYFLVDGMLVSLNIPFKNLMQLYQLDFALQGLQILGVEYLFLTGLILGLIGAWLAVHRQLQAIEP